MKRYILFFWIIACLVFPISGQDRAPLSSVIPALDAYIQNAIEAEDIPGTVVVIVKDGKVIFLKGFGVQNLDQRSPVDEHTPFGLASVTKNFTNTLVARLVDQGKLDWKDKVTKYLPDFQLSNPNIAHEITIEDLLSHRSGLPNYSGDSLNELGWAATEITDSLKLIPIVGEFRQSYDYQNVIVGLVGRIIEKVTGKTLEQNFEEELFKPIGLTETRLGKRYPPTFWEQLFNIFKKSNPQPSFNDTFHGKTRHLLKGNPGLFTFPASSGVISTGQDLGKWLIFQVNRTQINGQPMLKEASVNLMRSPHVDVPIQGGRQFPKNRVSIVKYGLGWFIHDYLGISMLSHMGGMAGTRSFLLIIPEDNLGIAILSNLGGMRVSLFPEAIRNKFLDLYLNAKEEIDWAKKLREDMRDYYEKSDKKRRLQMLRSLAPAQDLNNYIGIYENTLYGKIEIQKDNEGLILVYRDRPKTKLSHWNGNTFQFEGSDLSFGFSGTDRGEITFSQEKGKSNMLMINLLHEGEDPTFRRVESVS